MKVSILIFEVNEIDGMRVMMPQIKKEWYDELVVIDGGSTDGTIEYCEEHGYKLFIQKQKGVGAALNEGIHKLSGDILIIFAPDGSFEPEQIPLIIEKIKEGYDVVNVSRYFNGTKSFDDNIFTATGNMVFTKLANLMFPYKFTDFLYTYLGFRREVLGRVHHDTTLMPWGQMLLLRAVKYKLKIVEIPGIENKRIGGEVKVPKIRAAWQILRVLLHERFTPPV